MPLHSALRLPPLVPGWPILGNALELAKDPVHFWVEAARKYGSAFRVRYPTAPGEMTVLAGLAANEFATRHGHEVFTTREYYQKLTRETGTSNYICALDGEDHAYFRKVVKPALSREAAGPFVQDMIRMVQEKAAALKDGSVIPVLEFLQRITTDELSLAASGYPMTDAQFQSLARYARTFIGSGVAGQPEFLLNMPGYRAAKDKVHEFLHTMVKEREGLSSAGSCPVNHRADLMDIVARAAYPDGRPFNEADRVSNAHLPYANGVAYAGGICAVMLYALLKNEAILKGVKAEVDTAFAGGLPTLRDLRRMTKLSNCLKELHRRYPIAPVVPRYAAKTFEFDGYTIPEGSYVFIAIVVPHFDERYFTNPYAFDPDRFAAPRSEGARPYAFSPYGLGKHVCLSVGLVEVVVMTTICGLLRTLDFKLDPPGYELRFSTDPVPGPERAFRLRAHARRQTSAPAVATTAEDELETALPGIHLKPDELKRFAGGVMRRSYSPNATIIRQGATAEEFFVLIEGEVEIERESQQGQPQHLAVISPGGYFGEIGLLHGIPRTATVRAMGKGATVLVIGRELFTHMASEHDLISEEIAQMASRRVMVNQLVEAIPGLTREAMATVSPHLERRRFSPGEVVIRQGDEPDRFYVIVAGAAEVVNHHPAGDIVLATLGPGEYFGEIGILHNRPRTATVRAASISNLEVLALEREHFLALKDAGHYSGQAIARKAMQRLAESGGAA
jgi:cytochrome P450/CRP-like cAMP-binding protein